jgi:hypothetical protein
MKKRIGTVVALILGAGLVMALVGAVVGIHNSITPHVPSGGEGAVIGAGLGLILGGLLAGVSCWHCKALARGLGGAVLGSVLGLSFGLSIPSIAVPAGYLGALVGALVGSGFFLLLRSRILLGVVAGVWAAGIANPERYAQVTDTSRPLAELPPAQLLGPGADAEISSVDVTPKPVGLIPPWTIIGDLPPQGWSHLIIKTRYKVANKAEGLVSVVADGVACIFTSILARVEVVPGEAGPRHRLADLAVGAGAGIAGKDTILSTATRGKFGADLKIVGWISLTEHEKRWPKVLIRARSNTMAVLDDPAFLDRDGGHHPVVLRYVVLVEPRTGRLETLVWRVDVDKAGEYQGAVGPMEWLPPNMMGHCLLHYAPSRFSLGLPEPGSLALQSLPPGHTQVPIADALHEVLGLLRFTPEQAREMEKRLRNLVFSKRPG